MLRRTGDGGSRRLKWEIKKEEYIVRRIFLVTAMLSILTLLHSPLHAKPVCEVESLPQLPDVTIMSVTQETQYAPHCKVAGVVGPEIRFELLLPEKWDGKFVMGGGGGFVGSIVNLALILWCSCNPATPRWAQIPAIQAHSLRCKLGAQ